MDSSRTTNNNINTSNNRHSRIKVMRSKDNRYAPYKRIVRSQLDFINVKERKAFDKWFDTVKPGKNSQHTDLPSSHLIPRMSHINPNMEQLFAVLDTCSLIKWTDEFMDFVTHLRLIHRRGMDVCPIKFIISLTVLEELDKCNRPKRKNVQQQQKQQHHLGQGLKQRLDVHSNHSSQETGTEPPIDDLIRPREPPRLFMRFIEEEMRMGHILIGELDPYKKVQLPPLENEREIVNKDDRILECCLRSRAYIDSKPHHRETKVILVTEDNIFKAKATTFGVVSFRWREFAAKFRNFGQKNCAPTPIHPLTQRPLSIIPKEDSFIRPPASTLIDSLSDLKLVEPEIILPTKLLEGTLVDSVPPQLDNFIRAMHKSSQKSVERKKLVRLSLGNLNNRDNNNRETDDVAIVKEVINLRD